MEWGMANRMAQLIQSDGHALFLPIDHGYFQGPTRKLEEPGETIEPLLPYADALFITRGVLRSTVDPANTKPVILRVSGGTSVVGKDLANEGITTSMEEAIRLNVAAVGISVFVGTDYEKESLLNLSKLVDEGERYGIPVMAVTAVGKELEKRDARYLALASRIAAELGARVVKTYWCEDFEKVATGCPVPVVMAGGPRTETELEVFSKCDRCGGPYQPWTFHPGREGPAGGRVQPVPRIEDPASQVALLGPRLHRLRGAPPGRRARARAVRADRLRRVRAVDVGDRVVDEPVSPVVA